MRYSLDLLKRLDFGLDLAGSATLRAAVKTVALDDENCRPYFTNEAIIISIQTQDSICVNLGLYMINKIIGFYWELVMSVFRDPIN